ncbi:hypothetical protein [Streptomyces boncukensis]|uniref:Uncharacterized protein n=1 Tax=Streptomyces boncukensis TaxID=2711219 RepID=A0A6G4X329_9ACTN|nr:hypothetical protein [Streptomyces boncukensis]NGO71257.1 hypothetical protein [Streptomyces boncukensis]
MPLHVPPAPAPALRSVLTALGSPTAVRGARTPAALRAARGPVRTELPLPVHEMGRVAHAPATSRSAPRTRLTGWRFLLRDTGGEDGGTHCGSAEAVLTADGWTFGQFCEGPYVRSTERALRQAKALSAPWQPRLLSVPELYMLTLWLHGDIASDPGAGSPEPSDLLIPLAPAPPGIPAHEPRRVDALLPLLTRRLLTAPLLRTPA